VQLLVRVCPVLLRSAPSRTAATIIRPLVGVYGTEHDVHGEFASVLANADSVVKIAVTCRNRFGNQDVDRVSRSTRIACNRTLLLFWRWLLNRPPLVDDKNGVRRKFEALEEDVSLSRRFARLDTSCSPEFCRSTVPMAAEWNGKDQNCGCAAVMR
jgi:hypothetical protein